MPFLDKWLTTADPCRLVAIVTAITGLEIFGFNITIEIPREEDKTEQLMKKVKKLENDITYILNRLDEKDIQ